MSDVLKEFLNDKIRFQQSEIEKLQKWLDDRTNRLFVAEDLVGAYKKIVPELGEDNRRLRRENEALREHIINMHEAIDMNTSHEERIDRLGEAMNRWENTATFYDPEEDTVAFAEYEENCRIAQGEE